MSVRPMNAFGAVAEKRPVTSVAFGIISGAFGITPSSAVEVLHYPYFTGEEGKVDNKHN